MLQALSSDFVSVAINGIPFRFVSNEGGRCDAMRQVADCGIEIVPIQVYADDIVLPPGKGLELFDHFLWKAIPNEARGYAAYDGVRFHIFCDDAACADYGAVTNAHSRFQSGTGANPHIIADGGFGKAVETNSRSGVERRPKKRLIRKR